jgi:vacuolar protein sorting-associated protein 13A/C
MPYAWDYPAATNKRLRLLSTEDSRDIDILEIGNLVPYKFRTSRGHFTVSLDVRAENGTQTLSISNYVEEYSFYKPRLRRQSSASRSDTLIGLEAFETVAAEEVKPSLTVTIDLEGVGLSLINKRTVELLYLSSTGIKVEYMDSEAAQTINLTLTSIQLDNQLHDAIFPVILQPTPLPRDDRAALTNLPAVQASLMVLKDECW